MIHPFDTSIDIMSPTPKEMYNDKIKEYISENDRAYTHTPSNNTGFLRPYDTTIRDNCARSLEKTLGLKIYFPRMWPKSYGNN